jgi:hypothetical protein
MTKRETVLFVALLLIVSNIISGGVGYALADCPPSRVNLSCPDACPDIPDCNPTLVSPTVVAGEGVECYVVAISDQGLHEIHCVAEPVVPAEPDCDELDVEIERRHGVKMGTGYIFTEDTGAIPLTVNWSPKWWDQRNPWVPTTLSFTVSQDLEEFDADPQVEYDYQYASSIQDGPDGFPVNHRVGFRDNVQGVQCGRRCWDPTVTYDSPAQTRYGVSLLWTLK